MLTITGCISSTVAYAESPGLDALEEFRQGKKHKQAVENRFFLKQNRFEIAPFVGYVPNNPFARRVVGGLDVGYHFSEAFSAQVQVGYSPDGGLNDLKGLTAVLLDRAYNANTTGTTSFQQPLDKVQLNAAFGVAWAPIYGKINVAGETVLNFDFYGFVGGGMVSKKNYVATYDENATPEAQAAGQIVTLTPGEDEVKVAPYVGLGGNFFLNQFMAIKLDARSAFYFDKKPQYDPLIEVTEQRLYNNFIMSAGLSFFVPKMKPRLYNF